MERINVDGFSLTFLRLLQHSLLFDSGASNFPCSLAIPFTCSRGDKTAAASPASQDERSSCTVCVATNRFSVSTISRQGGVEHNLGPNSKRTAVELMDMPRQKQMLPWQTRAAFFIRAVQSKPWSAMIQMNPSPSSQFAPAHLHNPHKQREGSQGSGGG